MIRVRKRGYDRNLDNTVFKRKIKKKKYSEGLAREEENVLRKGSD